MNVIVSISDFRNNLSDYIDLIRDGRKSVEVKDEKKDRVVGVFTAKKEEKFNWDEYMKFVKSVGGKLFTDEDVKDIERARKATNRRFKKLNW